MQIFDIVAAAFGGAPSSACSLLSLSSDGCAGLGSPADELARNWLALEATLGTLDLEGQDLGDGDMEQWISGVLKVGESMTASGLPLTLADIVTPSG